MDNKSVDAFDRDLENRHIEGLWKLYGAAPSTEPTKALKPYLWNGPRFSMIWSAPPR